MPKVACPSCGEEVTIRYSEEWGNCWSCGGRFSVNDEETEENDEDEDDEDSEDSEEESDEESEDDEDEESDEDA